MFSFFFPIPFSYDRVRIYSHIAISMQSQP